MTTFDKREEGFEKKYALDEEQKFKAEARRNKLLGLWVAEKLGITGDAANAYAKEVVASDFEEAGDGDVVRKVLGDLTAKGVALTEPQLRVVNGPNRDLLQSDLEVHRSVDGVPFRLLLTVLPPDIARHRLHSAILCENFAKTAVQVPRTRRHCEERSDEAIQSFFLAVDCFASLAMTKKVCASHPSLNPYSGTLPLAP